MNNSIVGFGSEETKRLKYTLCPDPPCAQINLVLAFAIAFVITFVIACVIAFVMACVIAFVIDL